MKHTLAAIADEIASKLGEHWIPAIYADKVRTGRTRSNFLDVPLHENKPEILHTLLGIELKVGNQRFACPDLATARYLRVFARIGSREFAIPYDITRISSLADEFETSWHQTLLLLAEAISSSDASVRGRLRSSLVRKLRDEIEALGPGPSMPVFDTPTRQRR